MSYLSQIPITEVREWLRLDDNSNDAIITLMLANACRTFEDRTMHLIFQQSKSYKARQRIHEFPIADTTGLEEKNYYYLSDEDVTLTVGYAVGELPSEIKAVILTMVESQFYANENEGATNYPPIVKETINVFRRFYI
jgi:hypothetical protein